MVTAIWVGLKYCHGPSAAWPTLARRERKRKSATPVGMTEFGKGEDAEGAEKRGTGEEQKAA